jgi:hypothetical protein
LGSIHRRPLGDLLFLVAACADHAPVAAVYDRRDAD